MKRLSVKLKLTAALTVLMALLAGLLLLFMLMISNQVALRTSMEQLKQTVTGNLNWVEVHDRKPTIGEGFVYFHGGVTTLVYSQNGALLAGQPPVAFATQEDFRNGLIRSVAAESDGDSDYLVMDVWLPSDWEGGVWVRGLLEIPDNHMLTHYLLQIGAFTLPAFLLLTALGSWWITRRAFRPLDTITATAEAINEAHDLSGRIGLPPGKDEFSRLAAGFDDMFERLERSFEAEKQFTSDASHELRTPVAIIKGACEFAEKYEETPEERRETLSMIHRQADNMSTLIEQLLSMTRMEQGTEAFRQEVLDLSELVRTVCQEPHWLAFMQPPVRLHLTLPSEAPVRGSREQLERLVRNLIENGFKYGQPDGQVWITIQCTASEVCLSVRDDGIGIPAEEQDRIWQRFYQVDPARSRDEGAGLGLSMVQQIARLHGGYMTLESIVDQGSIFTLHLPQISSENSSHFM